MNKTYNIISKHRNIVYVAAIISVLYFHFLCIQEDAGIQLCWFNRFYNRYISSIGVEMFVFLSGMGLYRSMSSSTCKDFWIKRALRIFVPYFLVGLTVYGWLDVYQAKNIFLFAKDFFWINFVQTGINTFWYVPFILLMYLLYPAIYRFLRKEDPLFYTCLMIILVLALNEVMYLSGSRYWGNTVILFGRIPVFLAGCCVGVWVYEERKIYMSEMVTFIAFSFFLKYGMMHGLALPAHWQRYVSGIYGIALCMALVLSAEYLFKFRWVGKICSQIEPYTFELYLWNVGLWAMLPLFGMNLSSVKGYMLLIVGDIVLSVIVHKIYLMIRSRIKVQTIVPRAIETSNNNLGLKKDANSTDIDSLVEIGGKLKTVKSSFLYFVAYIPWVSLALVRYTYLRDLFPSKGMIKEMRYVAIAVLLMKFIYDGRYKRMYLNKNLIGIAVIGLCLFIEWHTKDTTVPIVMLSLFIFSANNIKFDDILKVSLVIEVCIMVSAVVCSYLGIIPNHTWGDMVRTRLDFGFTYCTFGSHLMLFITMAYICVRKKTGLLESILLLGFNYLWYKGTLTRLDFMIVVPFILACYIWPRMSSEMPNNIFTKLMFQYGGIIIAFFSILMQMLYHPENYLFEKANQVLSTRLQLGHEAIQRYGIHLFGQNIKWIGVGGKTKHPDWVYNYVDCSYLKYLLNYGLVFLIILMFGFVWMGKQALEEKKQMLCMAYIALYLFAMVDAELCVLAFHPFLLPMGSFFGHKQEQTDVF